MGTSELPIWMLSLLVVRPAEQGNAVDAFGPEPVRFSDARVGLGATDCCRSALLCGW
jgi:hypothetical protein